MIDPCSGKSAVKECLLRISARFSYAKDLWLVPRLSLREPGDFWAIVINARKVSVIGRKVQTFLRRVGPDWRGVGVATTACDAGGRVCRVKVCVMKRVLVVMALLVLGAKAGADTISDQVVRNLRAQGFEVVQMDRTWLGRMWILARNDTLQREVVFNPATGEVLRDYAVLLTTLNRPDDTGSDNDSPVPPQTVAIDPVPEDPQLGAMLGAAQADPPVEPTPPVQ